MTGLAHLGPRPRWLKWLGLASLLLLASLVWAAGVSAQGSDGGGTLNGVVSNGTPGGSLPVGADVTLQFYSGDTWTSIYTTTLEADGTFGFEGLSSEAGNDYLVRIVYQDVAYYSDPATFDGAPGASTSIDIYEPGGDASAIQVDQAHLIFVPQGDRIQVAEYYLLGNTGERTYMGAPVGSTGVLTTVAFSVPVGAESLDFNGPGLGARYVGDQTHFADTLPIPPGTATVEVDISYELAYREGLVLTRSLHIPMQSIVMIVTGSDVGIEGGGVAFNGMMDTQMGTAAAYTAGPLAAGVPLTFRLGPQTEAATQTTAGAASPTGASTPQRNARTEAGIGVVVLAVSGFAAYLIWSAASPVPPVPESAQAPVAEVAALDARYDHGEIDAEVYHRERTALTRKLSREARRAAEK